jgi:hypothetical protein
VEIKCQLVATDTFLLQILLLAAIKIHLLDLVGILFPHIIDDARSKPHQTLHISVSERQTVAKQIS